MDKLIIDTFIAEKGDKLRMEYVTGYVIPQVKALVNREVDSLDELKVSGYIPVWDTRNNYIIKKILEQLLNIKLTGVVKKDKITLQSYLQEAD